MKKPFLNQRRVFIAVVVLALFSSLSPANWAKLIADKPRHLVTAAIAPITHPIKTLSDAIRRRPDLTGYRGDPTQWQDNYDQLLQYSRRLEDELSRARALIADLSQAHEQLNLTGVRFVAAGVTAWSNNSRYPTLTLNRGSTTGLRPNLVVASGFNLVGRLSDVGLITATARLIMAAETQIMVRIMPPAPGPAQRELVTYAYADTSGDRFEADAVADDGVQVGDLAHLVDDTWPKEARGLVIGKVVQVNNHPQDPILRRQVMIAPIRSLAHLNRVIVIVPSQETPVDSPTLNPYTPAGD